MKCLHPHLSIVSLSTLILGGLALLRDPQSTPPGRAEIERVASMDSVAVGHAPGLRAPDAYTLVDERSLLDGHPARTEDGLLNVVVEIPSGTNGKWEVSKDDGSLRWEFKRGVPRVVQYLPYPGNYGMVPRTLLPKEEGGDGDPLDVLVLGPAQPRGAVVRARLIGVLRMQDGGEADDKLLAVLEHSPLGDVQGLEDLRTRFPGIDAIVEAWFTNYKGPGVMVSGGFAPAAEAARILRTAIEAFEAR